MPLTEYQAELARLLAANRTADSHLAGGAALHFQPNSKRYSNDLDYFHDSVERVAEAFAADESLLRQNGYEVQLEMRQPGYIRATIAKGSAGTKVEWAHDSAWRFMPPLRSPVAGVQLHPVDVSVNKTLALAGRDEPRDFIDILMIDEEILSLGALCWAAVGKDPGFTPLSLLELLRRRGKYQAEDFLRLRLVEPVDLKSMKQRWLHALAEAENLINRLPPDQAGCLYYSQAKRRFVTPGKKDADFVPHYGRPGGVLPRFFEGDALAENLGLFQMQDI